VGESKDKLELQTLPVNPQTFLEQFIEQKDNETSNEELDDDEKANASADFRWITVHARHDVDNCLTNCDDHSEELLGAVEEGSVLGCVTDLNDLHASQELHDETRSDDGRDTEFHECTTIGGENDTNPVEGIGRVRGHDTEEGNLTADKENEEGDCGP
jgi:hypothetical protein